MKRWRHRLTGILLQRRFWIEQIDMARTAFHEAPDDGFRAGCHMRCFRIERIDFLYLCAAFFRKHARQRDSRESAAGLLKELPA
jgi:hypothetical protein